MQNANEIRSHINAVAQTRKITNAMQLVASSRMKRVLQQIGYNQKYLSRVRSTMKHILQSSKDVTHQYLKSRGDKRTYIVISGDKGMAGAYNANILSFSWKEMSKHPGSALISVGTMASNFFRERGIDPDIELIGITQNPTLYSAREIAFDILDFYDGKLTDEVYIIFTPYGVSQNSPIMYRLLPILLSDYVEKEEDAVHAEDIIYIPSSRELFDLLVPQYLIGVVFGSLVHAYASEQFARMNAMQSATRNADEILKKLKMQYNLARQTAITQEITEITGAAEVLRDGDNNYESSN
ncbi:MAG: ATP synthase F1 subunit gamma [Eubacteriales bacterium]